MASKQLPFATALALTNTAKKAQEKLRQGLGSKFTMRRTWVAKGIQVKAANKRQPLHLMEAIIGSKDEFMLRQELGGVKKGRSGHRIAIPVGARRTRKSVTTKRSWPTQVLKRKNVFILEQKFGREAIIQRNKSGDIKLLYLLQRKVKVKKRWDFRETVNEVAQEQFNSQFNKAFDRALDTAK
ncbi:MAG: hypothetical protein GY795_43145 [Desulfobacterales bacterium]|nr:hypothetical protein [Desulfobacterales bacterium]